MSKKKVTVPDLGGAADVEVIELCVSINQSISEGQSLVVVESDKASMEIPSPYAGVVASIEVTEGSSVAEGDLILELESAAQKDAVEAQSLQPAPHAVENLAPQSTTASSELVEQLVLVPDLGGADQVEIIEIAVSSGDKVAEGDTLVVVESDKASMDIPAPAGGEVLEVMTALNSAVAEGDALVRLNVVNASEPVAETDSVSPIIEEGTASEPEPAAELPVSAVSSADSIPQNSAAMQSALAYAGPAVRKLARELSIALDAVTGSGPRSRITKDDLHNYVKQLVNEGPRSDGASGIPTVPDIDFSQFGEIDIRPMTKLHKLTAANMHRAWLNVPHVTQYDDADITELEVFRKRLQPQMEQRSIKVSPLPFIFKAVAAALRDHSAFNASLSSDGESIVYKKYIHIGMAVDTPMGLVVPVIRDVDRKGIWALSEEISNLAALARDRKLKPADMQGACFTISSLGGIGGRGFTPIINTPEVGILGVSRLSEKPQWIDGRVEPRKMLPLSLSYDHRAVNGGDAGRFMTFIVEQLQDVRHMLL